MMEPRWQVENEAAQDGPDQGAARRWPSAWALALACALAAWCGAVLQQWPLASNLAPAPASGVALAGLLLLGRQAFPAVLAGLLAEALLGPRTLVAVADALALGGQAWLGAWLIARQLRLPTQLRRGRKLLRLMALGALGGVPHAIASPLWHEGGMAAALALAWREVLGIQLLMPLLLFAAIPGVWRTRRALVVSLSFAGALVATVLACWQVAGWESVRLQGQFRHLAQQASHSLDDDLRALEHDSTHVRALAEASRGQAAEVVQSLLRDGRAGSPLVQGVALLEQAGPGAPLQARWQQLDPHAGAWPDLSPPGALVQASSAERGPVAGAAVRQERLQQVPLWLALKPAAPDAASQAWVVLLVDVQGLMDRATRTWWQDDAFVLAGVSRRLQGLQFRLEDRAAQRDGQVLLRFDVMPPAAPATVSTPAWLSPPLPAPEVFETWFGGRRYRFTLEADPAFWTLNATLRPAMALAGGLVITVLLTGLTLVGSGQRLLLQALVDKKTIELDQSLMLLEDTVDGYQQQSEQLKLVLRATPAGFLAFDAQGRVAFINDALVQLLDQPEELLRSLGRADFGLALAAQCKGDPTELLQLLGEDGPPGSATAPLRAALKAGAQRESRVLEFSRASVSGGLVQSVYLAVDVTESVRLEESKSQFLANAAHEIRTPLTSIVGYSHLLQRKPEMVLMMRSQLLQHVIDKADDLNVLLRNMLDLAELETAGLEGLRQGPLDLAQLAHGTLAKFSCPEGREAPQLELALAASQGVGNATKLSLMLRHLLANAYAFSAPGSPVRVALTEAPPVQGHRQVCLTVEDQGIGMPPEVQQQAFGRFYRADTSGNKPGFGLGLCIVKRVAELHRGEVRLDSEPGRGTRISVTWPLGEPA